MPLASSTDLILAGIHDIITALNNPSPGSPLSQLSDSQVAALRQVTAILTNVAQPDTTKAEEPLTEKMPLTAPDNNTTSTLKPATAQRVGTKPLLALRSSLRVGVNPQQGKSSNCEPLPSPQETNSFTNSTGPTGTKRRRKKRTSAQCRPSSQIATPTTNQQTKATRTNHYHQQTPPETPTYAWYACQFQPVTARRRHCHRLVLSTEP